VNGAVSSQRRRTAKRVVDALLLILLLLALLIAFTGGFRGEVIGIQLSATTPSGPIKILLALLLVRAAVTLRRGDFWALMISILISLALVELVLRMVDLPISRFQLAQIHRPSPQLDWELIPGVSSVGNTGATYSTNSRGCRDEEYPLPKPEGSFRILVLGDSFTFGMGVEAQATYPKQLELLLHRDEIRAEVINCGVIGHDLWQHRVTLDTKALKLQPDLVVLGLYYNDLNHPFPPPEIGAPGYQGHNPFAKEGAKRWLHHSRLYNTLRNLEDLLKYRFRAQLGDRHVQGITQRKGLFAPDHPQNVHYRLVSGNADPQLYSDSRTALAGLVASARETGVPVLVLLIPDAVQLNDPRLKTVNGTIAEAAAAAGAPFVDSTPALEREADPESLYLFPDDAHNSPKGLAVIAAALREGLQREGLLPSGPQVR